MSSPTPGEAAPSAADRREAGAQLRGNDLATVVDAPTRVHRGGATAATGLGHGNYTGVIRCVEQVDWFAGRVLRVREGGVVSGPRVLATARTCEDVEDCATLRPIRCKEDR